MLFANFFDAIFDIFGGGFIRLLMLIFGQDTLF